MKFDPDLYNETYRIPTARAEWWQYGGGVYHVTIKTQNAIQCFGQIIRNPQTHKNEMHFSELGKYVNEIIPKISEHQWYARVPVWTVMPNHVHVMIDVRGCETGNDGINQSNPSCMSQNHPSCMSESNASCRDVPWNVSTKICNNDLPDVVSINCNNDMPDGVGDKPLMNDWRTPELMSSISPKTGSLSLVVRQFKQSVTIYAKQHKIPFAWQSRFYDVIITKQYEFDRTWQYIENNVAKWGNNQ